MEIRLAGIKEESIVDGPGLRLVVFTQGCPHNCPGCHNPDTHDINDGYAADVAGFVQYIDRVVTRNRLLKGITFSGGEPFLQARPLAYLAGKVKLLGLTIVTYSGFTFEQLAAMAVKRKDIEDLLAKTDMLIDGPYKEAERDLGLAFCGSRNQRLIDLAATRAAGQIVLWQDSEQKRWLKNA